MNDRRRSSRPGALVGDARLGFRGSAGGQRGVALILVLWTFTVLSVLAFEFARAMREEAQSTLNFKVESTAHYVAIAAINEAVLAIHTAHHDNALVNELETTADEDDVDDAPGLGGDRAGRRTLRRLLRARGDWARGSFAGIPYEVRVTDEGGKIAINDIGEDELRRQLFNLGYEQDVVDVVSDSILDWIDEDDLHRTNGAEEDYYRALPRSYVPKNAPFEALEELLMVRGVTRQMYYGGDGRTALRDVFSVFASGNRLNLRTMAPAVMVAVGGISPEHALELSRTRGRDRQTLQDEMGALFESSGLGTPRSGPPSDITVEAKVVDASGATVTHIGAVMRVRDGIRAIRWYDSMFPEDD